LACTNLSDVMKRMSD